MPLMKSALMGQPGEQKAQDGAATFVPGVGEREDRIGGKDAAGAGGQRQRPAAQIDFEQGAENVKERSAKGGSARSAYQAGFDNRIPKQRLHERAAHARHAPTSRQRMARGRRNSTKIR